MVIRHMIHLGPTMMQGFRVQTLDPPLFRGNFNWLIMSNKPPPPQMEKKNGPLDCMLVHPIGCHE
jgi:hypothetical protein